MPRKTKAQLEAEAAELDALTAAAQNSETETPQTAAGLPDDIAAGQPPEPVEFLPEEELPFPPEAEASDRKEEAGPKPDPVIPCEEPPEGDSPPPAAEDPEPEEKDAPASSGTPPRPAARRRRRPDGQPAKAETEHPPAARPASGAAPRRTSFRQLDFKTLDKDLSPEQLQEWQSIYASFRSQSILTGTVTGVDSNTFLVTNRETGIAERRTVLSLVIISYRIKILIPQTEIWVQGEERPEHVIRGMIGAEVDYVIMDIDREGDCAIASRSMAMAKQQRSFRSQYTGQEGGHVSCRVIAVGPKRCLVECGGYDVSLTQRDLSYTAIADLRREYMPGQQLEAVFKGFSSQPFRPILSVKEVNPNPFDGAEARHPVRSRRHAVISGKYAGGVFCVLPDGVTCLCLYSNKHYDAEFAIGDKVIILITQYDYRRKLIYARIIAKW